MAKTFYYGGQAVIEGVMMRGRKNISMALRHPRGDVVNLVEPLSSMYTGRWRDIPLLRGVIVLIESLALGVRCLLYSANVAVDAEREEIPRSTVWGMLSIALALGIAIFFVGPLFLVQWLDQYIGSSITSNLAEGAIRLAVFILYLKAIGLMPDIQRVFAYHGAEHKVINAYESGAEMTVDSVQKYSTAHSRCGTGFLLIVLVVSIIVFMFIGRPPMLLRLLSRVALVPIIAGISYELMRLGAAHIGNKVVRAILSPSLALQAMTTRQPDSDQIEVAISALEQVLTADDALEKAAKEKSSEVPVGATTDTG